MLQLITRPMLKDFTPRLYQETIFATCAQKNTLVVLPTGMGKTAISAMLAANRLHNYPSSKILVLAPTRPLAEQHLLTFKKLMQYSDEKFALFTGHTSPKKRAELVKEAQFIFATPQGIENDIINSTFDLKDISLIVFDEAHRAVGDYSYVFIAKQYLKNGLSKVLALTASPGADADKITEVCTNLGIEAVEIRTENDPDMQPYIQEINIQKVSVELPEELKHIRDLIEKTIKSKVAELRNLGVKKTLNYLNKRELLSLQSHLHAKMASGERDFSVMKALSVLAEATKAQHALELAETQGVSPTKAYLDKLFEESRTSKVKAVQNLCKDVHFKSAWIKAQKLAEGGFEHPKIESIRAFLTEEISKNRLMKAILFTQYRDTATKLKQELEGINNLVPEVFVGQAKRGSTGLTQKQQTEMLQQFRDGLYNVLIATSVAEEGLDIPQVDLVLFYEPIPSAIRSIQRRGRTGRQDKGRVMMYITRGTRDEGYHYSAQAKERKMQKILQDLRSKLTFVQPKQQTLSKYEPVLMFADYREKGSSITKELVDMGLNIRLEQLDCADYVLSNRVGVELKKIPDFVASIIDGRFLEQLKTLRKKYERPIIIIQGEEDLYAVRNIHPNAIRGMLATIAVSYGIPIMYSKNDKDTAQLLYIIAKREQALDKASFTPHNEKKQTTLREMQEYTTSSLPTVGPAVATELLKHFGNIKSIANATEKELKQVPGVGEKTAKEIYRLFNEEYS